MLTVARLPFGFLLTFLLFFVSCTSVRLDGGYTKVDLSVSRDSILKVRKKIMDLPIRNFSAKTFSTNKGSTLPYRLLQPAPANKMKSFPLVIVLHGSHAVGTDNETQMGILQRLWASPTIHQNYPAYVVAPQFPSRSSNYVTDPNTKVLVSEPQACLNDTFELIESLIASFPINRKQIYIIGHSMGASGVTNAIGLRPDLFAAGVAASGIPNFNSLSALTKTPLWVIHGNADPENPIHTDLLLLKALQNQQAKKLRFTEVVGMEHEIWPGLFISDALPKWLFLQRSR